MSGSSVNVGWEADIEDYARETDLYSIGDDVEYLAAGLKPVDDLGVFMPVCVIRHLGGDAKGGSFIKGSDQRCSGTSWLLQWWIHGKRIIDITVLQISRFVRERCFVPFEKETVFQRAHVSPCRGRLVAPESLIERSDKARDWGQRGAEVRQKPLSPVTPPHGAEG